MKKRAESVHRAVFSRDDLDDAVRQANARMRHFRGVAVSLMSEAQRLWQEIWDEFQDPRSSEQILDGDVCSCLFPTPCEDRHALMEKLHLLGIQIEYARRLCEGSIGNESQEKGDR